MPHFTASPIPTPQAVLRAYEGSSISRTDRLSRGTPDDRYELASLVSVGRKVLDSVRNQSPTTLYGHGKGEYRARRADGAIFCFLSRQIHNLESKYRRAGMRGTVRVVVLVMGCICDYEVTFITESGEPNKQWENDRQAFCHLAPPANPTTQPHTTHDTQPWKQSNALSLTASNRLHQHGKHCLHVLIIATQSTTPYFTNTVETARTKC